MRSNSAHHFPIRIYYEDTDAGGIVYNANYLKFGERARTEMLREMGFENSALKNSKGILIVVRHIEADFFKPARLDDVLEVKTEVKSVKNTSLVMKQSIFCQKDLLFSMDVTLVCVDAEGFKPVRFPGDLKQGFEKFLG